MSLRTIGRRFPYGWVLFAVALGFLGLFFYYPLFEILQRSLFDGAVPELAVFSDVLGEGYYRERIGFTFWLALVSTVATLALGLPSAYVFARYDFPGRSLLRALSTIPFVMPAIVVAFGFIALVGPDGVVNDFLEWLLGRDDPPLDLIGTFEVIVLAHVFYNYTIVMRLVSGFWRQMDPRLAEAAQTLGAGRWQTLRHVTAPLLAPAIAAAALLVFIFSFTSFGVVLILGAREHSTLEVEIFRQTAQIFDLQTAAALSVIQAVFTFGFLLLYTRLQERTAARIELRPTGPGLRPAGAWQWFVVGLNAAVIILVVLSPLLALVQRSLWVDGGYSLANFENLFESEAGPLRLASPETAIRNSLAYACLTVVIAVPLGTAIAYRLASRARYNFVLDSVMMLPLAVSAVTLGFGFLIALDEEPLDLRATWLLLVIAHSLVAYPFVVRSTLSVLRGLNPSLREAASVLGAGRIRVFREIDLPIIWRALLVGAVFAFAVSLGEFGATLLLARPEFTTMPVAIFRALGQPGQAALGEALAMATVLMVVAGAGFLLLERFRYRDVGEF
ncbi:MAG TPA: iron ABC transporter permease [Dehalococcoidia bacterium]|nr:iron ABC transporter permease [Dehalococcoidia bacterium]